VRDNQDESLLAAVDALDASISAKIDSIKSDLTVMAAYRQLDEHFQFAEFGRHDMAASRLIELEENYVAVAALKPACKAFRFYDTAGKARINIVDGARSYKPVDVSRTPWFRAAMAADAEESQVSEVYADLASGQPAVTIYRPVWFKEGVRGVLGVDVLIAQLTDDLLRATHEAEGGYVYLVDLSGSVVASEGAGVPDDDASARKSVRSVLGGFRGIASAREESGEKMRVAYVPQSESDLGLVLAVPHLKIFAPVRAVRNTMIQITLAGFVVVALAGFWLVRRTVRPVRLLTEGAGRVAEGELDLSIEVRTGDEIEALAASFNRMTRHLRAARDKLEGRAAELEKAYADLQETQRQLMQAEKLGLLGQLAGGIAHDFNNLLAGILGCADLLRCGSGDEADRERYLEIIVETGQRAADLIRQLLAFARPGPTTRVALDVHDLLIEVTRILLHTMDPRITVETRLDADSATIEGDPSQLQSALLNLGINARDAMPGGGTLTFTTTTVLFDEATCRRQADPVEPGPYLEIAVADTGSGMTKEVLERIFEPFYTTKSVGQGTGLGLAAVRGTVRGHGGFTDVYSEPGRGTVFRLYLPLAGDAVVVPAGAADVVRGTGRILLVDDEPVIRKLAGDMLRLLGYEVSAADGGAEALELYRRGSFDLAILDLVMPQMNGRELLAEIRRIDPEARVLLASGFHLDIDLADLEREGACGFLSKPFIVASLSQAVAKALRTGPVAPLRVLVADDMGVNREVVAALLREMGHDAQLVEDGAAALAAATSESFDLMLLDVELPRMSGIEVTAAIRAHEEEAGGEHAPIIAVTGHGSADDRDRCLAAGMDGFLTKPLMLATLNREIARVLGRSAAAPPEPYATSSDNLTRRIAAAFLEEVPERLDELRGAIERVDAEALRRAAHALYGALRHFDAVRASGLADALQQSKPAGDPASVAAELEQECESLMRSLEASLAKGVGSST